MTDCLSSHDFTLHLPPPLPPPPSPADYHSHPSFMPYEQIDETKKDDLRSFSQDLLRYMRMSGFEPSKTRSSIQRSISSEQDATKNHRKFALQFFNRFFEFLSRPKVDVEFYLKVLFPVVTAYLQKYAGYFMPFMDMQNCNTASKEEKVRIIK